MASRAAALVPQAREEHPKGYPRTNPWAYSGDIVRGHMPLRRKLRKVSHTLVLTIPSQIAQMCGLEVGTVVEVEAIGRDALRVTKFRE